MICALASAASVQKASAPTIPTKARAGSPRCFEEFDRQPADDADHQQRAEQDRQAAEAGEALGGDARVVARHGADVARQQGVFPARGVKAEEPEDIEGEGDEGHIEARPLLAGEGQLGEDAEREGEPDRRAGDREADQHGRGDVVAALFAIEADERREPERHGAGEGDLKGAEQVVVAGSRHQQQPGGEEGQPGPETLAGEEVDADHAAGVEQDQGQPVGPAMGKADHFEQDLVDEGRHEDQVAVVVGEEGIDVPAAAVERKGPLVGEEGEVAADHHQHHAAEHEPCGQHRRRPPVALISHGGRLFL